MSFPTSRLDLTVEMAFGADLTNPTQWVWTDVSSRLLAQSVTVYRGRSDESSALQPASFTSC